MNKDKILGRSPAATDDSQTIEYDINAAEDSEATEDSETTEETESTGLSPEELEKILAPIDGLRDDGITLLESNDIAGGLDKLNTALEQYITVAQTNGVSDDLATHMNDGYVAYVDATISQVNILYEQPVSAGLYEQMSDVLSSATTLSARMQEVGFDVDASSIEDVWADLPANYKERYIIAINELTEAESWSRSTAWSIMEDVPELGLYDESDLDDPLRLRYAYSLAMYTRKMNDADLASGSITPREAGMKILDSIEEMDYNPIMILDAANYFKQAGENYTADVLFALYDDLNSRIEYYQGLRLPKDIPWEKFWYFNDFGAYSVDDVNGVSQECRQAIRDYAIEILSSL